MFSVIWRLRELVLSHQKFEQPECELANFRLPLFGLWAGFLIDLLLFFIAVQSRKGDV